MQKNANTILVSIYSHVEGYPPTLNAIQELSARYQTIVVVQRNSMKIEWDYPGNVILLHSGGYVDQERSRGMSAISKLLNFFGYCFLLWKSILKYRPAWILLYDPLAVLAWGLIRKLVPFRVLVWYHNHDVITGVESGLSSWAFQMQNRIFNSFDIFSLPADERKEYFPMKTFKGTSLVIRNYPGKYHYGKFANSRSTSGPIRLIFQGQIGPGHAFEQILEFIAAEKDRDFRLVLKGYRNQGYLSDLQAQAQSLGIADKLEIHGFSTYKNLPALTATCHIGIGIYTGKDIMNSTLGTASNKIYEYAAVGLPVLLHNHSHFRGHLSIFAWTFFTTCEPGDIRKNVYEILDKYDVLSQSAHHDFLTKVNFECEFRPALEAMYSLEQTKGQN